MDSFSFAGAVFTTPEKLILFPAILLFFIAILVWRKDTWLALVSTLIVFLPFNSSLRLDFGPFVGLYNPYVHNIEVNYLVPTVYLSDFLLLLTFAAICWSYWAKSRDAVATFIKNSKFIELFLRIFSLKNPFFLSTVFGIYAIIHLLVHPELLVIISLFRLSLFVGTFNSLLLLNPATLRSTLLKHSIFVISFITLSALFQLYVAYQQIVGGTEVGLYMLGESSLEAGRKGVSFVSGFGNIFLRGYGTFPHPNVLGAYLVTIGIFVLLIQLLRQIAKQTKNKLMNTLGFNFALLIITLAILLTFSRSATVVWTLVILIYFSKNWLILGYEKIMLRFKSLKLAKLNSSIFNFGLMNIFGGLFGARESSLSERISQLLIGIEIFKNNIFFGVGAGSYMLGINDIPSEIYYEKLIASGISILQPSHNVFATYIVEHGAIGAVVFAAMLLIIAKWYFYRFNVIRKLAVFLVIVTIPLLVFANLDHYLYTLPVGILISLLLSILAWSLFQVRRAET